MIHTCQERNRVAAVYDDCLMAKICGDMVQGRFLVRRDYVFRGKWTSLPQSSLRTYLTCPRCLHEYPLVHAQCGIALEPSEAIGEQSRCPTCTDNGQDPSVAGHVADCPSCGQECRSLNQINDPEESAKLPRSPRSKQSRTPRHLRPDGPCSACGSPCGLHVHHKDWNHENMTAENLMVLCEWCHMQTSKLGKPEFDRLLNIVSSDPVTKKELRKTSEAWYQQLPSHRNVRSLTP